MRPFHVYTAEGIVLKRKSVGEADRILTVFTRQFGKIRIIAKGVRRITSRRSGHVEVFSHVVLTIHTHKSLDILTEAQAKSRGTVFESDVGRLGYAYCMCELVDQLLPDRQEHEDVFFLLRDGLLSLESSNNQSEWQHLISRFVHDLLRPLGFLSSTHTLRESEIQSYIEDITERKFRTWPLLTVLGRQA